MYLKVLEGQKFKLTRIAQNKLENLYLEKYELYVTFDY